MERETRHRVADALSGQASAGATTAQIGEAVLATCRDFDSALTPIIGSRGVGALYQRSLHLAARSHPWLVPTSKGDGIGIDTASLKAALGRQAPAVAAAGGGVLLQTFQDLLQSLVGESLTERLLLPAWTDLTRSPSAQGAPR